MRRDGDDDNREEGEIITDGDGGETSSSSSRTRTRAPCYLQKHHHHCHHSRQWDRSSSSSGRRRNSHSKCSIDKRRRSQVDLDRQRVCRQDRHGRSNPHCGDKMKDKDLESQSREERVRERHSLSGEYKDEQQADTKEEDEEILQLKLAAHQEEEDVNRIKEESRKRCQAILEKYRLQQSQKQKQGDHPSPKQSSSEGHFSNKEKFWDLMFTEDVGNSPSQKEVVALNGAEGNVSVRMHTRRRRRRRRSEDRGCNDDMFGGGSPPGSPKRSKRLEDMFCDDKFRGDSPVGVPEQKKEGGLEVGRSGRLSEDWDDGEGYFVFRHVELVLCGRYKLTAAQGKGVFSTVVRARDLKAQKGEPEQVAIKIIRDKESMFKTGLEEVKILKKLAAEDPEDRHHCIRCISSFQLGRHLCLVMESLDMNLRELINKFCKNRGLSLTAVREHAKQLFRALMHLKKCGIIHSDIKPENILINETKNALKLCDFGNAMPAQTNNERTPYLVSRFYRPPEVILGLQYGHSMDMWSVGCCLWELYTGKMLFPGATNHVMLHLHMELKGAFPTKMLRKGAFTGDHFDSDMNFYALEEGLIRKKPVTTLVDTKRKDEDPKLLASFKNLLETIFTLDPGKRMTVSQALNHPFITTKS